MLIMHNRRTAASDLLRRFLALMWPTVGACAACIMLLGQVGCTHPSSFADHPKIGAEACGLTAQEGGAMLGADVVKDSRRAADYFKADLPHSGVLPIYVVVENHAAKTFLVSSQFFSLNASGKQAIKESVSSDKANTGSAIALTGVVMSGGLLGAPLLLIGAQMYVDAKNEQANMKVKGLQIETLSPGESGTGFIYFPVDRDPAKWPATWELDMTVPNGPTMHLLINNKEKQ